MDTGTLYLLGTGLKMGAQVGAGFGAFREGQIKNEAAKYAAAGYERQGTEAFAAGLQEAAEARRKGRLVRSEQLAKGAASGSALTSPGLLDIIADTTARSEQQAGIHRWVGESQAAGFKDKANMARVEGKAARMKGINQFAGSILDGATTYAVGMDEYKKKYKHG